MKSNKLLLISFLLLGVTTMIYEIAWIRPLQIVLVSTVYTTTILFAAFMAGLSIGSFIMSKYIEKIRNLPDVFVILQAGIALYGPVSIILFNSLPDLYRTIYPLHQNFYAFQMILYLLLFTILLIPTALIGAAFPVAVKIYTAEKIGERVGTIYSINNIGAILGSLLTGVVLIPVLGIKPSIITAGVTNLFAANLMMSKAAKINIKRTILFAIPLFFILAYFAHYDVEEIHTSGYYAGAPKEEVSLGKIIFYKEGPYSTVAVKRFEDTGALALFINGKGQGSNIITDWRVNLLSADLPLTIKPDSQDALIIGLGTGTTSGQLSQAINVTTIEIDKAIVDAAEYFSVLNHDVLSNKNHKLVLADARSYLLRTNDKYDIILHEPSDPWQSYSSNLYSKEFLKICSDHLKDEGLYVQWVPVYELGIEDFKSIYKTFSSEFPYAVAFANIKEDEPLPVQIEPSELILVGSKLKIETNNKELAENFEKLPDALKKDLRATGIDSIERLLFLKIFTSEQMEGYADKASFVTDDNLKLEFSSSKRAIAGPTSEVMSDINSFLEKRTT